MPQRMGLFVIFPFFVLIACRPIPSKSFAKTILNPNQSFEAISLDDALNKSVGCIENKLLSATAFYIGSGRILTNFHVVSSCDYSQCDLVFKSKYRVQLLARRLQSDLAMLRIVDAAAEDDLIALQFARRGRPFSDYRVIQSIRIDEQSYALRLTSGKILDETVTPYGQEFSYTANTVAGSSGSPVVDDEGQVVGIHKGFDSLREVNLGTDLRDQNLFLEEDLAEEFTMVLGAFEASKDTSLKYDLAEILLQTQSYYPLLDIQLWNQINQSVSAKSLHFYLLTLRKLSDPTAIFEAG
ncbi:MAG: trypsin-like peptidase domain-containing protein [Chitinophagaceae bacterium]|nr:trypsin-like peptidase domain-containing protein [Oligoflexus sp.]